VNGGSIDLGFLIDILRKSAKTALPVLPPGLFEAWTIKPNALALRARVRVTSLAEDLIRVEVPVVTRVRERVA
jgi:hypothetical protein